MLLWVLLGLLVLLTVGACVFRDLLYVAVSLALVSAVLAGILFHYGANIAGVFELSVCAGLITVLFVSTVGMTKDSDQGDETRMGRGFIPLVLLVFIGLDVLILRWLGSALPSIVPGAGSGSFQNVFWNLRSADILGQVVLILAGVFGISALFRLKVKEKKHE
ncbi:MAG: NADH-quinone oxidoreductase subunit J [Acidobacteria bacterium]|nr:NADH-quinone oxidoreductase subunit J [Acidobacteriota bacterium]